jgi:2-methylcitrate dehydratase PrpD
MPRKNNGEVAPPDTMGAQYSFPYCAALALTGDPSNPDMYAAESIADPSRRELARRVELVLDAQMEAAYPKHYGSRIELHLASGERRDSFALDPHGMPADPCTPAERLAKFRRLTAGTMSEAAVASTIEAVRHCEDAASVRDFTRLLRGNAAVSANA